MKRILFGVFLLFFCFCMQVEASEIEDVEDTVFKAFDFGEVNQVLEDILPEEKMDFGETVRKVIKGDVKFSVELLEKLVTEQLFYEFRENKKTVIHILMIAIIAAVFTNFSNVFQNRQIGEISFYVLYLLLITICLSTFQILIDGVGVHLSLIHI